jgi:GTP diphosphokinase / guanosine-3',5'-bis(diphosphate) 3'-diphosphatase
LCPAPACSSRWHPSVIVAQGEFQDIGGQVFYSDVGRRWNWGVGASHIPVRQFFGGGTRFAPDGGAVPGDRIVGIMTPGEGITIFPIQSPTLKTFDDQPERWLDVRWEIDEDNPERFPTQIIVNVINEPGSLARIAQIIGENDANIDNIKMTRRSHDFHEMLIDLEVWDLKHLNAIISLLKNTKVVASVSRVNG